MSVLRMIWFATLAIIPLLAWWLWWEDGMWSNGAMPTHGFFQAVAGCALAQVLYGLVWLGDRRKEL